MNRWDEIKIEIRTKHANFKSLPLLTRISLWLNTAPIINNETFVFKDAPSSVFTQTYRTYFFRGISYFYKWGSGQ